ncbi:RNA polymerase [Virgisporangium aliadipatigenens]|uniref:RNA polymerase n=1 Tax=Virgisporangium aliadipatigenens TaxID=741659 RepID=A0A8J3YEP1_9ACTN|nr:SigE family RNA polymerase sigma factor [Virgisporangium aliadipatigenens]GIJ43769.1 RNA polymerase [Virgisporangium aliadipatigenens]
MTFEEYVAARGDALVRFARLLTGDPHRAEDLVQDALAKAYLRWRRILATEQPDAYLRRMVVNGSRSWWRRRSNQETPTDSPADRAAPDRVETDAVERDDMWRRIVVLPQRQRAVLVLRYYEDLDDAAIAGILGCSAATVRTHAMRALNTLRQYADQETPTGRNR